MFGRILTGIAAVALAITTNASAQVIDLSKYPDFSGQWKRPPGVANQWDTSKPPRRNADAQLQAVQKADCLCIG